MTTSASPNPWQSALGHRLAQALEQSRFAHAPQADAASELGATRWRLPSRVAEPTGAAAALSEMLGTGAQAGLVTHCLQHYRNQLAPGRAEDDLGVALAAYLGACRQAFDHEALSPQRWQAITQWVKAWVIDELPWDDAPLLQRQDAFERLAVLTVALGEWTVQASRQGGAHQASATWMARNSLQGQLGLDLPALCAVLRNLDGGPANTAAVGREGQPPGANQGATRGPH
ncbi:DUF6683 family protein [Pelomonas sp. Root1237]|uniref:DUF6683 family protein n=1 Tax=Pelomonas sp. Root1237 TaxID=1736434 RepID=UPI0006F2F625|nr:DUF6683 family protein [Pelomonas sp. Root1237]KQV88443.1 hypothetical protein ASC91_16760 [Pelomonas sp. Root1237]